MMRRELVVAVFVTALLSPMAAQASTPRASDPKPASISPEVAQVLAALPAMRW